MFPAFTFDTYKGLKSHIWGFRVRVCVCVSLVVVHISLDSDQERDRTTALWISQSSTTSRVNASVCVCCCAHCPHGCGHPTTPTVSPVLHRVRPHFLVDPIDVMCDAGVDPRLVLLSAAVAPADHAHQSHLAVAGTDQRATRVSLQGPRKVLRCCIGTVNKAQKTIRYILTLQASSRPRVSPAHSMLEVTVRPDSTSGVQRASGHSRT